MVRRASPYKKMVLALADCHGFMLTVPYVYDTVQAMDKIERWFLNTPNRIKFLTQQPRVEVSWQGEPGPA